jgi:lariat debranching enzyme
MSRIARARLPQPNFHMRIAVEGCAHGELDNIYNTLRDVEQKTGKPIDVLLCCGDFQAIRDRVDLGCVNVKDKYKEMGSFHQYFNGEKSAPYLTVFIGGNHEASNYLQEKYHGGWVAPNIYFCGFASALNIGGLRIIGLSGIYKDNDYERGWENERSAVGELSV